MVDTVSEPQNSSKWTFLHNTFNKESWGDCFPVLGWTYLDGHTLTWTRQSINPFLVEIFGWCGDVWERNRQRNKNQEGFMVDTVSEPQNSSKWTFLHNTLNKESWGDCFPVLRWKYLYRYTLTWTRSKHKSISSRDFWVMWWCLGKKPAKKQESRRVYGGYRFRAPKFFKMNIFT